MSEEGTKGEESAGKQFAVSLLKFIAISVLPIIIIIFGSVFIIINFAPSLLFLIPFIAIFSALGVMLFLFRSKIFRDYQKSAVRYYTRGPLKETFKEMQKEQLKMYKEFMKEQMKEELREQVRQELKEEMKKSQAENQPQN